MKMVRMLLFAAAITMPAFALMQAYSVEPVKAAWSGKVRGDENHPVSQTVTCCWDSVVYCELFVGRCDSLSVKYKADVYEYPGGTAMAHTLDGGQLLQREHSWLKLPLVTVNGRSFTKGKTYEFRFTRSGSDSIQYYWDEDPYQYGSITDPTQPESRDLCMRCYGLLDPIDSTFWGTNVWSCTVPSVC
jgi:hypothetical protein